MRIKYNIMVILGAILMSSCSSFLEESSQDEVRPETATDLQQLLLGEGYQLSAATMSYIDLLTDDVQNSYTEASSQQNFVQNGKDVFAWKPEMFESMKNCNVKGYNSWQLYYQYIKGCNVVLDYVDKFSGSDAERGNVKGQALALRAYYYFMLCNLYAKPYNLPGIDRSKELGVPLMLKSAVTDEYPKRNTLAECYQQIEKDLLEAEPLMDKYGNDNIKDKVTSQFVHHLLCRLYLYEERWDESIAQADIVLKKQPGLLKSLDGINNKDKYGNYEIHVYSYDSPEMIWRYASGYCSDSFQGTINLGQTPAYSISADLSSLYDYDATKTGNRGDLRALYYYTYRAVSWTQREKYWGCLTYTKGQAARGFRTAEDYLNRAECYIHKFIASGDDSYRQKALDDLNTLRESRWEGTYTSVSITSADELLKFYRDERRRELAFDDHRWFDLRRYGEHSLSHTLTLTKGQPETYILEEQDKRFTLQIPQDAIDRNPSLVQNPR